VYPLSSVTSTSPSPARQSDLRELIVQGLRGLRSEPDLQSGWLVYRGLVTSARAEDIRRLVRVERVLEHLGDAEPALDEAIPRRLRLVTEDLRPEFDEAWSRLLGRSLVEGLKLSGFSLRTLADRVAVSAPYLSQLSAGGGPVPSERIIAKLRRGFAALELLEPPHEPTPSELFSELANRANAAREHLKLAPLAGHRPRITVDHPPSPRIELALKECFEAIAERYVDESDGALIKELVEALVSADHTILSSLAWLARDEQGSAAAVQTLRELPAEVRLKVLELIDVLPPTQRLFDLPTRLAKREKP
jgi:transcriptional regulator with XRE-family HTH domain